MSGPVVIIELEGDRMLAVEASVSGERVRVRRAASARRGDEIAGETPAQHADPESSEATGVWIRAVLDAHGFKASNAVIAVSRGQVLTKHLDIPRDSLSPAERHEMIRLQMSRQASLTSADNVIDYAEDRTGDEGGVTAAAMPTERVAWRTSTAAAAGLKLTGIRLRSAGIRAILAGRDEPPPEACTLVIAPGVGSVELVVLVAGEVVYSRSIDTPTPADEDEVEIFAKRIAVEASRSIVSFRVAPGGRDVDHVTVIADEQLARALSRASANRLEMPVTVIPPSELIEFNEAISGVDRAAAVPLAGLLLCKPRRIPVLDFANPTGAPDTGAALRQVVLAGVFFLIILGGAGYLFAQDRLGRDRAALEIVRQEHADARDKYAEALLVGARLGHMRAWTDSPIDPLAHLAAIIERMPSPTEAALGELNAQIAAEPVFASGKRLNDPTAWSTESALLFRVSGAARERHHAQAFRQRLLDTPVFTVASQGPEVENRFELQISTTAPSPEPGPTPPASEEARP